MGICNDYVAHPLRKFDEPERKAISKHVEEINYMIENTANRI